VTAAPPFVEAARAHARLRPDDPAILDGVLRWSWAELDRRADAMAARLVAAVIEPGDRVGLLATSSAAVAAALHGMARAGVVAVPIGPRLARPEIAALAAAARLQAMVAPRATLPAIEGFAGIAALDLDDLLEAGASSPPRRGAPPGTPAVIVATSGTSGRPKLVRLGASQLDASARAWSAALPPATGWLLSLNLAHVSGIGILVRAARAGVPVVVPASADGEPIVPSLLSARLAGVNVSHISLVTPQLVRLLDASEGVAPPAELRAVLLGGGPIPESLVSRAVAAGWPVVPSYGMTETASGVAAMPLGDAGRRPWSAGRALSGVELRIEAPDGSTAALVAPHVEGEILVRGPMVFDGYENDPEASAAALDSEGWLHTGDLGSLDREGWLRVVARRDEIIISGGENVAPAEIEAVLASHPAVADVGVAGVPDEKWGSVPVAVVAFRPGAREDPETLRAFARERLASFKAPARIVEAPAIPRSPSGKLLRRLLPALVGAAGFAGAAGRVDAAVGAGRTAAVGRRLALAGTTRVEADDGQPLAERDLPGPTGAPTVVLLHATVSTSRQLLRLAGQLRPDARVLLPDRRGSGASVMETPAPVSIARHVADLLAVLDAAAVACPVIFGHSFGALLALEFAARHPERAAAVVAYEPPYLAAASPALLARLGQLADAVAVAHATGGPAAAAQLFVRAVAGDDAWASLAPAQRASLEAEGSGALADTSMGDLDLGGLSRIACPVVLATGGASDDFYAPIADALAAAISCSRRVVLPGLRHVAPVTDPVPFAELIQASSREASHT
jgi:O-succinylbenzoic acid--CoA ligase